MNCYNFTEGAIVDWEVQFIMAGAELVLINTSVYQSASRSGAELGAELLLVNTSVHQQHFSTSVDQAIYFNN